MLLLVNGQTGDDDDDDVQFRQIDRQTDTTQTERHTDNQDGGIMIDDV